MENCKLPSYRRCPLECRNRIVIVPGETRRAVKGSKHRRPQKHSTEVSAVEFVLQPGMRKTICALWQSIPFQVSLRMTERISSAIRWALFSRGPSASFKMVARLPSKKPFMALRSWEAQGRECDRSLPQSLRGISSNFETFVRADTRPFEIAPPTLRFAFHDIDHCPLTNAIICNQLRTHHSHLSAHELKCQQCRDFCQ
jgi:hypothetical protein